MLPLQLGQKRRKHVEAHRHAAEQPDLPAQRLLAVGDPGNRVLQVLEDAMRQLQQRVAGRSDPDAAADAEKDRLLQLFFEQQDLAADRRLRDVQLVAGGGERAGLGDGANDLELTKVHAFPSETQSITSLEEMARPFVS